MINICSLYYQDYFKKINFKYLFENNKDIIESNEAEIKRINKILIEDTAKGWGVNDIRIIPNEKAKQKIEVKVQYPGLITGVGINHEAKIEGEFKLGMHFDNTYGMPVIYGSSVKGLLRSAFPATKDRDKIKELKTAYVKKCLGTGYENVDVEKLRDGIFEGIEKIEIFKNKDGKETKKTHYLSIYKRDIFFDAVITKPYKKGSDYRILESDSITPHGNNLLKNPVPITFMKIASGVSLEFRFDLKDYTVGNRVVVSAEKKKQLFRRILKDFGIGAKTNVGYGQFVNTMTS